MDPLRDLEKASSTQTMVEDVENRRNLNMKSIEVINEVNAKVIETRLIRPARLISLTEDSLQCVEHKLKT
jgi:phosphomevalonate kinase